MLIFQRDTWQEIYHSLRKNKLRTVLTMIGVAWGMFLYVGLQGAAKGMENGFDVEFKHFATNGMAIWAQRTSIPYDGYPRGRKMELNLDDVKYLEKNIESVELIAPRTANGTTAVNENKSIDITMYGDFPESDKVSKKEMIYGRFLNDEDVNEKRKVCVLGKTLYERLFEKDEDPIGKFIRLNGIFFQVIGVYKLPTQDGFEDEESAFIPFLTFQQMYNEGNKIGWMIVLIKESYDIKKAEERIKEELKARHNVAPEDTQAFGGFNFGEMIGKVTGFVKGMTLLSSVVGVLTIFAGIIAISSILLITVKERTKEIGIRRALGAKPSEIRGQILIESVFLTVFSGMLGFMMGIGALALAGKALSGMDNMPFYNPTVELLNVLGALVVMVGLGLLIGLIPAQRAVMIKPIEALRTE